MLRLAITVSANRTSPSDPPEIVPAQGDDSPAEEVFKPTISPDSRGLDQSTAPGPSSPPPEHPPIQSSTPIPRDQAEMSLSEKAQFSLDRAVQAEKTIDRSNTWQGVVEKIKFVMDTLSPVAGVRVIDILFAYPRLSLLALSAQPDCTDGVWSAFSDPWGALVCIINTDALLIWVPGTLKTVST
jgi:hypothetical protein